MTFLAHLKFENKQRKNFPQNLLIIRFTEQNSFYLKRSYPGRNFEGNQQLNVSISISPLYANESTNLHVRTLVEPPPCFHKASFSSRKDQHLSGCSNQNFAQIHQILINSDRLELLSWVFSSSPFTHFTFISRFFIEFFPLFLSFDWSTPWSVLQDGLKRKGKLNHLKGSRNILMFFDATERFQPPKPNTCTSFLHLFTSSLSLLSPSVKLNFTSFFFPQSEGTFFFPKTFRKDSLFSPLLNGLF